MRRSVLAAAALVAACAPTATPVPYEQDPWTQLGGDATRSAVRVAGPVPPLELRWTFEAALDGRSRGAFLDPVVAEGRVVASADRLYALDTDGRELWTWGDEGSYPSAPVLSTSMAIVADVDEDAGELTLAGLELDDGRERWSFTRTLPGADWVGLAATAQHAAAFVNGRTAMGFVLDPATGRLISEFHLTSLPVQLPVIGEGIVVALTEGGVDGFDLASGERLWHAAGMAIGGEQAALAGGSLIARLERSDRVRLVGLDIRSGEVRFSQTFESDPPGHVWVTPDSYLMDVRYATGDVVEIPLGGDDGQGPVVVVEDQAPMLEVRSLTDGSLLSRMRLPPAGLSHLLGPLLKIGDGVLLFAKEAQEIGHRVIYTTQDEVVWESELPPLGDPGLGVLGTEPTGVASDGRLVFVSTLDGRLLAFGAR